MDRKIGLGIAFGFALGIAAPSLAQQAVQWRAEDGGNGHWYQLVVVPGGVDWPTAREVALSRGGDLTTITSAPESDFVRSVAASPSGWGSELGPWLGGYQDSASTDYAEPAGAWRWVSGEAWAWAAWNLPGSDEPNNCWCNCGPESYLHYKGNCCSGAAIVWNDLNGSGQPGCPRPASLIIEWSADCNGDGIVDYGQILDGTFADSDSNGIPDTCECLADLTGDGQVNGGDLSIVLGFWGTPAKTLPAADLNGDGTVNAQDLSMLLSAWGPCPG